MEENKSNVFSGFLGFYIVIFVILTLFNLYESLRPYVGSSLGLIFLIFSIYVLYLTFSKKRIAKLFNIIHMWLLFLIPIILDLIDWLIPPNYGLEGIGAILSIIFLLPWAIIWTIYFIKSKRVRNTFVK